MSFGRMRANADSFVPTAGIHLPTYSGGAIIFMPERIPPKINRRARIVFRLGHAEHHVALIRQELAERQLLLSEFRVCEAVVQHAVDQASAGVDEAEAEIYPLVNHSVVFEKANYVLGFLDVFLVHVDAHGDAAGSIHDGLQVFDQEPVVGLCLGQRDLSPFA